MTLDHSTHATSLTDGEIVEESDLGSILRVTVDNLIPRAYPHHIEVIDSPDIHFAIFFDQPTPGDIGYRASASAYSREVHAATFNVHIDDLPRFPFTKVDPLIVSRNNPVDAR